MRNYKLKTIEAWGPMGRKQDFTEEQKEQLIALGFRLVAFDSMWEKYLNSIKLCLPLGKQFIYFYDYNYFLPCELNEHVSDKETLKQINTIIKELKQIGVI